MKFYVASFDTGLRLHEAVGETSEEALNLLRQQAGDLPHFEADAQIREYRIGAYYFEKSEAKQ